MSCAWLLLLSVAILLCNTVRNQQVYGVSPESVMQTDSETSVLEILTPADNETTLDNNESSDNDTTEFEDDTDDELFIPRMPIRRYVDPQNRHFFTTSDIEGNRILNTNKSFRFEHYGGYLSKLPDGIANTPLFRIFNNKTNSQSFALHKEKTVLKTQGWKKEGIMGYCSDTPNSEMIPLYLFSCPTIFDYIIVNEAEKKWLSDDSKYGYKLEGLLCYAYETDNDNTTEETPSPPFNLSNLVTPTVAPVTANKALPMPSVKSIVTPPTVITTKSTTPKPIVVTPVTVKPPPVKVVIPPAPIVATKPHVALYRLQNGKDHFYTTNAVEYQPLLVKTLKPYKYEGITGYFATTAEGNANVPIYRMYLAEKDDHMYVTMAHKNQLIGLGIGWKDEGLVGYCSSNPQPGMSPWHRFFNRPDHDHIYTAVPAEFLKLTTDGKKSGWEYEGITCYVYDI